MGENEQKGWWMLWWRQSRISSFKENKVVKWWKRCYSILQFNVEYERSSSVSTGNNM